MRLPEEEERRCGIHLSTRDRVSLRLEITSHTGLGLDLELVEVQPPGHDTETERSAMALPLLKCFDDSVGMNLSTSRSTVTWWSGCQWGGVSIGMQLWW